MPGIITTNPQDIWTTSPDYSGLVSLGTHSLHLHASGPAHSTPSVIIEGGLGAASSQYIRVHALVAAFTRVYSYDRAGFGASANPPAQSLPLSAASRARDLRALIDAAGIPGPYVLVGHSYGGALARQLCADFGGEMEVAGAVFVDSPVLLLDVAVPLLASLTKLGDAYCAAVGLEKSHVLSQEEWARWKKDGKRGVVMTHAEYKEMGASMKALWDRQRGSKVFAGKKVSVIHGDSGADFKRVCEYAARNKKLSEREREEIRDILEEEDFADRNETMQRELLKLSERSRFVQAQGKGRTHNIQFVQPELIADEVRWVCELD